jgi:outer membrane protein W
MKHIYLTLIALLSLVYSHKAKAQEEITYGIISYQNALLVGDYSNFINTYSYNGANFELNYFLTDRFSAGVSFAFQKYYQELPRQTYQLPSGDGAVTANLYRWLRQIPLKVNAHYYLGAPERLFRPYVALGAGALSVVQETTISDYVIKDSKWSYIVTPEIGFEFKADEFATWGLISGVKYDFTGYHQNNAGNLQAVLFHAGVYFEIE